MKLKKILALVLSVALCLLAAGAWAEEMTTEEYEAKIAELEERVAELEHELAAKNYVAEFDGGAILVSDAMSQYDYLSYMYSSYGISMQGYEDMLKQEIAQNMVKAAVEQHMAEQLGLKTVTEEKEAELRSSAATLMDQYLTNYRAQFESEDLTEEEIVEKTMAYLEENGVTLDSLYDQQLEMFASDQLFAYVADQVSITDEDVENAFNQQVLLDMQNYTDPYAYESAVQSGSTIYWHPEGYRDVRQVLIAFDDEQKTSYSDITGRISGLEAELDAILNPAEETEEIVQTETAEEPRTEEEVRADLDAAKAELDALYALLQPKADEVAEKFNAGTPIDELIAAYGGDPGSINADGTTNTYRVSASSVAYDQAFTDAAMSVSEIGGLSEPGRGMYGLYIVYYDSDVASGSVDLESVRETLYNTTLDQARSDAYTNQIDAWCEELNVVYYLENFR